MNIYSRPVVFAIVAAVVVLIGTVVTTFIPMMLPTTQPVSKYVKPYTAIELEGRDIYIREGCNNCHTQTVRPLVTEVARYGEYSKPEEFAYDRPFLWGSRRTGPDLARVGGKYPDSWHYQHTVNPQSMFARSNMPPFRWLAERKLDTSWSYRKVSVLGYGYSREEVEKQIKEFRAKVTSPDYPAKRIRDQVTPPPLRGDITELDALVAYLQKLGRDLKELRKKETAGVAAAAEVPRSNPYSGNREAAEKGKEIFEKNCQVCHGKEGGGGIGPNLRDEKWIYGSKDSDLYESISRGRKGGMPPFGNRLSSEDIWKVITYIRTLGEE
ncbi:MAG: cytochrome-c oxidase, cbb3-type subunit II [Deltaproteobacteria bacterium]|nr:MAG: cytochrome-c oxidase, cbb3-type subunit II [Deltaproteobacteria bacterium]